MKCKFCRYERFVKSKAQFVCDALPDKPVLYFIKDCKLRFVVREEPCGGKLFRRRITRVKVREVDA